MLKEITIGISTAIGTTLLLYFAGKITQFPTVLVPPRAVVPFHAESCPDGWKEVEFTKGRFVIGVGETSDLTSRYLEQKGGEETHALTIEEMPKHKHQVTATVSKESEGMGFVPGTRKWRGGGEAKGDNWVGQEGNISIDVEVESVGENKPHNNMPPYVALLFCEKE